MTYSEKLKDPLWQRKRLFILTRDAFKCQMCGDDKSTVHVHHRHYLPAREPWDYPDDLLVTLCENCHHKEEQAADNAQKMLNTMHHWGVFNTQIIEMFNKIINSKISEKIAEPHAQRLDSK